MASFACMEPEKRSLYRKGPDPTMIAVAAALAVAALAAGQEQPASKADRAGRAMFEERFEDAAKLYRELVSEDPANPGLLLNLGLAEQSLGNYRDAVSRFRAVVKLQPETTIAWLLLGAGYRKLGEPAEAVPPLQHVVEAEPSNRAAALELAEALFELGRFEDAAARFYHLVEIEPSNPRAWQALGACYVKLARRALAELGVRAPDSAWWWTLAGRERAEAGRLDAAYTFYREALKKDPQLGGVRTAIAEIYAASGHPDWASVEQAREAELAPPDCDQEAPACELREQRYWQAVELAGKLGGPRALYWKALAYYELAGVAFGRLAELPLSAERYERLAEAHRLMGRHAEAAKMWREALALAPEDQRLAKEYARSLADSRGAYRIKPSPEEIALTPRAVELERSGRITAP
jgi:tetratricopeptide (TPR) repeat protein